jgi:hypothetical protein
MDRFGVPEASAAMAPVFACRPTWPMMDLARFSAT